MAVQGRNSRPLMTEREVPERPWAEILCDFKISNNSGWRILFPYQYLQANEMARGGDGEKYKFWEIESGVGQEFCDVESTGQSYT